MKTLKGPALFLGQFAGDTAPFDSWDGITKWAADIGYVGVQVPTWAGQLIDLKQAAASQDYCDAFKGVAKANGIEVTELSTHLQGQLVAVNPVYDAMFDGFAAPEVRGNPKARQEWAVDQVKLALKASNRMGIGAMATFSGALAWPFCYPWPQRPAGLIETAFEELARRWTPILDVAEENGVDICYEIHPNEDLFDGTTYEMFLDKVKGHKRANMLYDPSHYVLQCLDYLDNIDIYHERIRMFHVKDAEFNPTGRQGVYSGYASWVDRAGRFRSLGDGQVDFGAVFSKLAAYDFDGWAVVEWECCLKHPEDGAREGAEFVKHHIIRVTEKAFDDFAAGGTDAAANRRILGSAEPAMKAGFGFLIWTTHVTEAHLGHLDAIKAAGYDGVEVPMFEGAPEHFRWLGQRIADSGLVATAIGVMAGGNPTSADAAERRAGIAHLDWLSDCATALGAEALAGPFHQPLGQFSGRGPTEDELGRLAEAHRAMADRAPELILSVEPLNRFECYMMNTAAQAAAHVAAVNRPNFGYLYDTFHANIEERDPVGVIGETIKAISYIHISENDRGTPGKGHIDHAAAIRAAKAAGYDGWFAIEAFGSALPDLAAATRVWRPLFDSDQEVVEAGARVIRSAWDR